MSRSTPKRPQWALAAACAASLCACAQPKASLDDDQPLRVLIVYSDEARALVTSETSWSAAHADLLADADLMEDSVNDALDGSGNDFRIRIADTATLSRSEADFRTESDGDASTDKETDMLHWVDAKLQDSSSRLARLRRGARADLVVVLVRFFTADASGVASTADDSGLAYVEHAAAIVQRDQAIANYTLAHELGHLLGAHHDLYVEADEIMEEAESSGLGLSTFGLDHPMAFGWVDTTMEVRSIMAYEEECVDAGHSCARAPRFSNPHVDVYGRAFGSNSGSLYAYNACALERWFPFVSNYYEYLAGTETYGAHSYPSSCGVMRGTDIEGDSCYGAEVTDDAPDLWVRKCAEFSHFLTFSGSGVTDPSALTLLRAVQGTLTFDRTALTDLSGLPGLADVDELLLVGNDQLLSIQRPTLTIWSRLQATDNPVLVDLDDLRTPSAMQSVHLSDNPQLRSIDGLWSLTRADDVIIEDNGLLVSLFGLSALETVDDELRLQGAAHLTSLSELARLETVGGALTLTDNPRLTDCALPRLSSVGSYALSGNTLACFRSFPLTPVSTFVPLR